MRILLAIFIGVIGPGAFLLATGPGLYAYHAMVAELGVTNIAELCEILVQQDSSSAVRAECTELTIYSDLQPVAWAFLVASIALPLVNWSLPSLLGKNRMLLAHVYGPLFPLVLLASIVIVLAAIAFVAVSLHIFTTWTLEIIWFYLYIIIAIGVFTVLAAIVRSVAGVFSNRATTEFGEPISPMDVPQIGEMVADLSRKLGAEQPRNIILGAAPTFYITNAPIELKPSNKKVTGETMFVSTTLASILSKDELEAVIAHELMHYRGQDLVYTSRFYPIYKTLQNLIARASQSTHAFTLPLLANLGVLLDSFTNSERRISRERELEADRGAAEVTSGKALGSALSKIATFSHLWQSALSDNSRALRNADFLQDVTSSIQGYVVYECDEQFIDQRRMNVLQDRIAHPTDTHPTIDERFKALGLEPGEISDFYFSDFESEDTVELAIASELKSAVTTAFHLETIMRFGVRVPADGDARAAQNRNLDDLVYQIVEQFILADEDLDASEVKAAEKASLELWPSFNPLIFRERLHGKSKPHDIVTLAEAAGAMLTREALENVLRLIDRIIDADGVIDPAEREMRDEFAGLAMKKCDEMDAAEQAKAGT